MFMNEYIKIPILDQKILKLFEYYIINRLIKKMSNYPWDDGSGDTSKSTKYTLNDLNRAAGVEGDN